MSLKRSAEEMLEIFNPISTALNRIQASDCKLSESVLIWKKLKIEFANSNANANINNEFDKRYYKIMSEHHFVAFLLSPKVVDNEITLSEDEKQTALTYMEENFPLRFVNDVFLKFIAHLSPFREAQYKNIDNLTDTQWWNSMAKLYPNFISTLYLQKIEQFTTAVCSSASIERTFSRFSLTQTKLRNKLGNEKASKLVFVSQQLNQKICN